MDITIVLQQMMIIFLLIGIGIYLYKKKMVSEATSKDISGIIVNVTNPAILICSAFNDGQKASLKTLAIAMLAYALVYAVLIVISFLIPILLRVPRKYHYAYQMLTIFGNVGFIGIPLASAVLGPESLIFVSIYNLLFNFVIYTFGISTLEKAKKEENDTSDSVPSKSSFSLAKIINIGTISALLTIILYLLNFNVPVIVSSTLSYAGRATTFLSMLVLGVSVAQMSLKKVFSHPQLYGFVIIRQILIPIGLVLLFRPFVEDTLVMNTLTLMLAVPAGNMPLMFSNQMDLDSETIAQGIILTTILSLITIPIVSLF